MNVREESLIFPYPNIYKMMWRSVTDFARCESLCHIYNIAMKNVMD